MTQNKRHIFPGTYIIVPSRCQQRTVQILNGRAEDKNKIVVSNRIPRGRNHDINQLWLWDGEYFQCAKNPCYCIWVGGRNGVPLQLGKYGYHPNTRKVRRGAGAWDYEWGTITSASLGGLHWSLKDTGNNSPVITVNGKSKVDDCFWRLEKVGHEQVDLGFGPFYREQTCVIVPAMSPGKTVHLDDGRTENGTKIVLFDRKPVGNKNYVNQLWLWNGEVFRSAKDPTKCLYISSRKGYVQLGEISAASVRGKKKNLWKVKRNHVTGLCTITNGGFGGVSHWITPDLEGHNHTPVITLNTFSTVGLWTIQMVPAGPEKCFTPSLL